MPLLCRETISIGDSHNYYMGRAEADIAALFTFSGRISASREASDAVSIADAIAGSPLAEAIDTADESLAGGRKLTEKVNKADITKWVEYFVEGMAVAFENVLQRMAEARTQGRPDQSSLIRQLDPRQRKVLELFQEFEIVTSRQIGDLFGFKPRTSAHICKNWVEAGFLEVVDPSNRGRKYRLSRQLLKKIV